MKGLRINCTECGNALKIRTSDRPTEKTTKAIAYCEHCEIKFLIMAEVLEIYKANYQKI